MDVSLMLLMIAVVMSVISFVLFGVDKWKAKNGRWRISEATLLLFCMLLGSIGGLLGMHVFRHKTRKLKFRIVVPICAVVDAVVLAFLLWTADYYHAGQTAQAALRSDGVVSVEETAGGWLFDGPSDAEMLVFYPGAKVEETAYAPLLHTLAADEMDVYLVKMPLHLAFFNMNAADAVVGDGAYDRYFIGGHSLGGAMAASYAASHENAIDGQILLAAYPTDETAVDTALIYGSADGVLNMDRVEDARGLVDGVFDEYEIGGGNHAQFGDYGAQAGDGDAAIAASEQLAQTLAAIDEFLDECRSE